ncbi:hypothetical protein [Blastopirellula retiformator]|uniref:hypothetical protein n=1 Tax=Blastopirellula retiformator TaxID=2527970 RepID=UPI0011B4575B|nr:hypothetical protein [Blastopirellula retiformator]
MHSTDDGAISILSLARDGSHRLADEDFACFAGNFFIQESIDVVWYSPIADDSWVKSRGAGRRSSYNERRSLYLPVEKCHRGIFQPRQAQSIALRGSHPCDHAVRRENQRTATLRHSGFGLRHFCGDLSATNQPRVVQGRQDSRNLRHTGGLFAKKREGIAQIGEIAY